MYVALIIKFWKSAKILYVFDYAKQTKNTMFNEN